MIVQTCSGLRRSHRRNALILAIATLRPLPKVVTPTPPARQTQAEASDTPNASMAAAIASVARLVLIIPILPQAPDAVPLSMHQSTSRAGSRSRILLNGDSVLDHHRRESLSRFRALYSFTVTLRFCPNSGSAPLTVAFRNSQTKTALLAGPSQSSAVIASICRTQTFGSS
jgi:hypothetical protein